MPFIVKDSGVIIENRNIDIIVHQVRKIINSNPEDLKLMGKKARKSIVSRFSIENRENAFLEILGHTTKR